MEGERVMMDTIQNTNIINHLNFLKVKLNPDLFPLGTKYLQIKYNTVYQGIFDVNLEFYVPPQKQCYLEVTPLNAKGISISDVININLSKN